MASKIVVIGAISGQFPPVFDKLTKLHSKNSFSLAIILGDLFEDPSKSSPDSEEDLSSLLRGAITVPLPTYFTLGKYALPQQIIDHLEASSDEVCPNLYFLGKRSITKTSEGLRIVALGGTLDTADLLNPSDKSESKYLPLHTEEDVKALRGANSADILITSSWPLSIRDNSCIAFPDEAQSPDGEQYVADLCAALHPRYHFSISENVFYEREPFFHPRRQEDDSAVRDITRFISLAAFANPAKQKWLYAFSLDPQASAPLTLPTGVTLPPISLTNSRKKRPRHSNQEHTYSRFSSTDPYHHPFKRSRHPPPTPSECYFCLSSPNLATHLITSIADDAYLTTAKGPLSTASTFPPLPFPNHILIIPLAHSSTFATIPTPETRTATYKEMTRYRTALQTMLLHSTPRRSLGAVTWEVSRATGIHIHWQFLPVPTSLIKQGLVEAAFKVEAENEKYPLFQAKEIGDGFAENSDYFRVWIWRPGEDDDDDIKAALPNNGADEEENHPGKDKSLILPLSNHFRFDLQFGRRVMAKLLELEARMQWKDCMQSQAEEAADAEAFKKAFKAFDFSLEEEMP
ncbi:hypothetical protein MMC12_005401 [Toensbergia leucococca]|nr:hypothetical protein [Toensbergia leucococca]